MNTETYCAIRSQRLLVDQIQIHKLEALAFYDSISWWSPYYPPSMLLSQLRRQYRKRLKLRRVNVRSGNTWITVGYTITVQQPTRDTIIDVETQTTYKVSRVDVAIDILNGSVDQLDLFLKQAIRLLWNRDLPTTYKGTLYTSKRSSKRNVVVYSDRPSKSGLGDERVNHIELRFVGVAACKRAKLGCLEELLNPNPFQLLKEKTKLVPLDEMKLDRMLERVATFNKQQTIRVRGERVMKFSNLTVGELKERIRHLMMRRVGADHLSSKMLESIGWNCSGRPLAWCDLIYDLKWVWDLKSRDRKLNNINDIRSESLGIAYNHQGQGPGIEDRGLDIRPIERFQPEQIDQPR